MIDNIVKNEVNNQGVYYYKSFLEDRNIAKFKKILFNLKTEEKGNENGIFCITINQCIKEFFKLNFKKFYYSLQIMKFEKNNNFKKIAKNIFNENSKLIKIDSYISKKSDKEILEWHCDQAYSGRKNVNKDELQDPEKGLIKFFIFLTPASTNNGTLSIIKKSHKITLGIKKAIYNLDINYTPFWNIFDIRKIILNEELKKKISKYLDNENINEFIKETEIFAKSRDTFKYDKKIDSGDMIIFDEHTIHRAAKPSLEDRFVIRFMYGRERLY